MFRTLHFDQDPALPKVGDDGGLRIRVDGKGSILSSFVVIKLKICAPSSLFGINNPPEICAVTGSVSNLMIGSGSIYALINQMDLPIKNDCCKATGTGVISNLGVRYPVCGPSLR